MRKIFLFILFIVLGCQSNQVSDFFDIHSKEESDAKQIQIDDGDDGLCMDDRNGDGSLRRDGTAGETKSEGRQGCGPDTQTDTGRWAEDRGRSGNGDTDYKSSTTHAHNVGVSLTRGDGTIGMDASRTTDDVPNQNDPTNICNGIDYLSIVAVIGSAILIELKSAVFILVGIMFLGFQVGFFVGFGLKCRNDKKRVEAACLDA